MAPNTNYYIPKPPPLPKYDPAEDPPRFTYSDIINDKPYLPVKRRDAPPVGVKPDNEDKPDWRGIVKSEVNVLERDAEWKPIEDTPKHYFWFDTPDYADPLKKLGFLGRCMCTYAVPVTLLMGYFKNWFPITVPHLLNLAVRIHAPMTTTVFITGTTAVATANLRGKKDDMWNYVAGGLAGALFLGRKNHVNFFQSCLYFAPLPVAMKYNAEINGQMSLLLNKRLFYNYGLRPDGEHFGLRLFPKLFNDPGRANID